MGWNEIQGSSVDECKGSGIFDIQQVVSHLVVQKASKQYKKHMDLLEIGTTSQAMGCQTFAITTAGDSIGLQEPAAYKLGTQEDI